jgi:hypothetical protein
MISKNQKFKKSKTQNMGGVTLVEVILYLAIGSIFMIGVVAFGAQVINVRIKSRVQQEVIANSRLVMKRIAVEIRNATAITSLTPQSLSLTYADSARNPTVIAKSGNRITIGWGSAAPCPTSSPCFLTSSKVSVDKLLFANMSDGGGKSVNVKYELEVSKLNPGGRAEWSYTQNSKGSAEVKGK